MFISNRNASRSSSETDSPYVFGPRDTPLLSLNRTRSMRCDATGVSAVIVAHESHARARRTQKNAFFCDSTLDEETRARARETPPPPSRRLASTRLALLKPHAARSSTRTHTVTPIPRASTSPPRDTRRTHTHTKTHARVRRAWARLIAHIRAQYDTIIV